MCSEPTRLTHLDASGAGEGRLGVHEPVLPPQRREMGGEGPPIAQAVEITEEGQPGRHCRAPQLGLDDDPPSACPHDRTGRWYIIGRDPLEIMEVLTRYGIRASAALNSEVCDHHPEIIEEAGRLGWELVGHNQTNALRLTEMDGLQERDAVRATIDRIETASGKRPVGWLGAGLAETWNTLDYLAEAGIRYVCDWVNDDQPYLFEIGTPALGSLPYSVQTNDVPAYFEMKVSVPEFGAMLKRQFDTLYREGETIPRVMAIEIGR